LHITHTKQIFQSHTAKSFPNLKTNVDICSLFHSQVPKKLPLHRDYARGL
jgi:hypothetical protein